jgi:GAF domain-containing protein
MQYELRKLQLSQKAIDFKNKLISLLLFLFSCLATVITGNYVVRYFIRQPIRKLETRLLTLLGRFGSDEEKASMNGLKVLHENINDLEQNLHRATEFARNIGQRKLDFQTGKVEEGDELTKSLEEMRNQLKRITQEEFERNWSREGVALFSDILRSNQDNLDSLSYEVISKLVNYLKVNQGALFLVNEDVKGEPVLELRGCYAYNRRKKLTKIIQRGQGLVGQSWYEGETIYVTQIPDNYTLISSGLGDARPTSLLIVPLKLNEQVYGVIELASFNAVKPYERHFVEQLAQSISSTISSAKINSNTKKLLEESQQMTEQLRSQEEEMRQNMEELQATQEEVNRKGQETEKMLSESNREMDSLRLRLNLTTKITFASTPSEAFRITLEDICRYSGWHIGHALQMQNDNLISSGEWYLSDLKKYEHFQKETRATHFQVGIGLVGKVAESKSYLLIENLANDKGFLRSSAARSVGLNSAVGFPVFWQGKVVAILEFFSVSEITLNPEILELIGELGKILGQTLVSLDQKNVITENQPADSEETSVDDKDKARIEEAKKRLLSFTRVLRP